MTTQRDGTNTPAGEGRPTTDRPGELSHFMPRGLAHLKLLR